MAECGYTLLEAPLADRNTPGGVDMFAYTAAVRRTFSVLLIGAFAATPGSAQQARDSRGTLGADAADEHT